MEGDLSAAAEAQHPTSLFSFRQCGCRQFPLPQQSEGVPSHDRPEPTGKSGGVGEARQGRPRGDERLLNHVLSFLKIAGKRQCRTEGRALETPQEFDEGF